MFIYFILHTLIGLCFIIAFGWLDVNPVKQPFFKKMVLVILCGPIVWFMLTAVFIAKWFEEE